MRYTAKARMLSFDFLIDDMVYTLPPVQAMMFAGMVARADNLGRLPGDPMVLLSYLFFPRAPRNDFTADDARDLLGLIARRSPPIARWYRVGNQCFVELAGWAKHQPGIKHRKSDFPGPETPGAESLVASTSLQTSMLDDFMEGERIAARVEACVPDRPATSSDVMVDVGSIIRSLASAHTVARTLGDFDSDRVWAWAKDGVPAAFSEPSDVMKFARWLWRTGTKHNDALVHVLDECRRLAPENPYAYFSPDRDTRTIKVEQGHAEAAVAEGESFKQQERAFLEGQ